MPNLLTTPRLTVPALLRISVLEPLPPVSVSPPTAAAETWILSFSNPPVKLSVPVPAEYIPTLRKSGKNSLPTAVKAILLHP